MKRKLYMMLSAAVFILTAISCNTDVRVAGKRADALDDGLWENSVWISAADAEVVTGPITGRNKLAADGCSWFVSEIQNAQNVVSAVWMTAGLGVYDLYLNGNLIGEEVLKPGFTHYAKTKLSFTYDITDAFKKKSGAQNQLSAQVTPGWWGDLVITPGRHEGMIGKKCAFRGVLELTYADGTKEYFGTNLEDWKAGIAGPVKHAGIFDGERFDAREVPGYVVVEKLSTPEVNTEYEGEIIPSEGAEVYQRKDLALEPVQAYVWSEIEGTKEGEFGKVVISREYKNGETIRLKAGETLVVDFGQNAAAVPSFLFKAPEGTVLTCLPSEILNDGNGAKSRGMDGPEGSCHRQNLRMGDYAMILEYTFAKNRNYARYTPRCSFFGYRYISVTATDEVLIKSVESIPVTSVTAELQSGKIVTGNELINKLISNTIWGMYSNYLSVPTDCPQRDERLGWTADTQVFAETGTFFANTQSFMHKWMRDMRDTQTPIGSYSGVAPLAKNGINQMRLGWADAGIIVPWIVWKQYNDLDIIEENWESMEKYMNLLNETKFAHKNIASYNGNYQWADWLSYEPLESSGGSAFYRDANNRRHPIADAVRYWDYLALNYWMIDAGMMCDMAKATDRDESKYVAMYEEAKAILLKEHLNADGTFKTEILNTMQTPALFALKNKLVEGKAKEDMIARLRENFKQHDDCLQTGFLGTSILMQTLTDNDMADVAYNLLFQRKNPSWIYSIDNGATTMWERWNSYTIEHGMGPKGMNSFNHYAYGCVCEWIWETAAGISCDASAPGFSKIIMKPVPDKRLGFVEAEYKSVAGTIRSAWRYEGDQWIWDFTVPEGAVAEVTLPGEQESKEYAAGTYSVTMN